MSFKLKFKFNFNDFKLIFRSLIYIFLKFISFSIVFSFMEYYSMNLHLIKNDLTLIAVCSFWISFMIAASASGLTPFSHKLTKILRVILSNFVFRIWLIS